MRGLPDSAVYGTYKRLKGVGKSRSHRNYNTESALLVELLLRTVEKINDNKGKVRK